VVVHQGDSSNNAPTSSDPDPEPPPIVCRIMSHLAETLTFSPTSEIINKYSCFNDADTKSTADTYMTFNTTISPNDIIINSTDSTSQTSSTPIKAPKIQPVQHVLSQPQPSQHLPIIRLLQQASNTAIPIHQMLQLHIDGGANRSVTCHKNQLMHFKNIKAYYMSSASGENDTACTGAGYIPWQSRSGQTVLIKCY